MKKLYYRIANKILHTTSPCNEIIHSISEGHDRKLSLTEKFHLKTHMKLCHCCTRYKKQLDNLHDAIHSKVQMIKQSDEIIETLSLDASNRIKNALRHQMGQ